MNSLIKTNNPLVLFVLRNAGWYPGREVDVTPWVDAFLAHGKPPIDSAIAILREFGGLQINPPKIVPGQVYGSETIEFNPRPFNEEPLYADDRMYAAWERVLGKKVYQIGYDYAYPLFVDETGAVYISHELAHFVGEDIDAALRQMILRPKYMDLIVLYPGQEPEVEAQRKRNEEWLERIHRDPEWLRLLGCPVEEI